MLNEIRPTHRVTDKLREKAVQRYMRHSRQAQEKRTKEKTYSSRAVKDALSSVKATTDKVAVKFQKDTKAWAAGVNDKFEGGKAVFNASFEVSVSFDELLQSVNTESVIIFTNSFPFHFYLL